MILFPVTDFHPGAELLLKQFVPTYSRREIDRTDDTAYARLLVEAWAEEGDLVVIEQDIAVHAEVVPGFINCHLPWCAHAYPIQGHPVVALGCTRFSAALKEAEPDLMRAAADLNVDGFGAGHWRRFDVAVDRELRRRRYTPHRHTPDVGHLHEY